MSVVMNLFGATDTVIVLCGRHKLHIQNVENGKLSKISTLDLKNLLSDSERSHLDNISAVCCCASRCSNYAIVADSEKNVFMFVSESKKWRHLCSWKMEKRIVKVQFDKFSSTIILTDKTGDVYVCFFENMTVSPPNKILGHCSLILDTIVADDNTEIYTSDRDEKIRISLFPNAYEITNFLLGHREAVVNIGLVKQDSLLVSASCDGIVKIWDKIRGHCIATWNMFEIIQDLEASETSNLELMRMRATDNTFLTGYLAAIIKNLSDIHIFKVDFENLRINHHGQVKKNSDFCDVLWNKQNLYVFTPEGASIEKYVCNDKGIVPDSEFKNLLDDPDVKTDITAYATFHKSYVSLKKLAWVDKSKEPNPNKYGISKLKRLQSLELDSSVKSCRTKKDVA